MRACMRALARRLMALARALDTSDREAGASNALCADALCACLQSLPFLDGYAPALLMCRERAFNPWPKRRMRLSAGAFSGQSARAAARPADGFGIAGAAGGRRAVRCGRLTWRPRALSRRPSGGSRRRRALRCAQAYVPAQSARRPTLYVTSAAGGVSEISRRVGFASSRLGTPPTLMFEAQDLSRGLVT